MHCVHLDKMHLHVMTQVSKVEGVVDTTGAGKGLNRLVEKLLVMVVIIVKETHWLEAFLLPLPLTWTLNRVSGDQKLFLDERYIQK